MNDSKNISRLGAILLLLLHTPVYAHITSQEGVLAKSYHEKYGGYYIGGEAVGWSIDEKFHTNGTSITYSFSSTDPYLTDTYKSYVTAGAAKWSGTVTFTNKTDGTGLGTIRTYNAANSGVVARFTDYDTNSTGNRHVNYCTQCNGLGLNVTQCVYNANNVCKICGTPKGTQPYALGNSLLLR